MQIKFKRKPFICAVFTAIVLAALIPTFCINAASTAFVVSTTDSVKPGEEFKLEIKVNSNSGFAGFDFELHYSNTSLTLKKVEFAKALSDAGLVNTSDSISEMPYKLTFASANNFTQNTTLVTLTFKLSSNAKLENHEVYITGEAVTSTNQKINATFQKGGVVPICSHTSDLNAAPWVKFNYVEATCTTPARTYYRCSECQQQQTVVGDTLKPHDFKDYEHKDATCTENGYDKQICKNCQWVETTKTYSALGHKYSDVTDVVLPTCISQGYTVSKCTVCKEETRSDYTDKIAHDMKESSRAEPTCSAVGYIRYTCSVCSTPSETVIPTVEHSYLPSSVVEPTHLNKGYTIYRCKYENCTHSYNDNYTDEIPHTFEYTVVKEPTCMESGFKTGICSAGCNITDEVEIPATGHTFGEWYCALKATQFYDGYDERACVHCNAKETKLIPRLTQDADDLDKEPKNKLEKAVSYVTEANHPAIIAISLFAVLISLICVAYIITKIIKIK